MATRYIGMVTPGPQALGSSVIGASSGGTLAGSQVVQVVFDDTVFVGQEGKQRLLNALEFITSRIESARIWPIDSTS